LDQQMQRLQPARHAVAHGSEPAASVLDRFIGVPEVTPADADRLPWYTDEQRNRHREARARSLELLRCLFIAYLAATLRTRGDQVEAGLTRTELVRLLQDAQRDVRHAREHIRAVNAI